MLIPVPESDWLPGAICIAQTIDGQDAALAADEARLAAATSPRRRAHFAAGRACAHEALRRLGHPAEAVLRSEGGAPVWPAACIGSIAHCDGMAVAIVAPAARWRGLGIDVEPDQPLPDDVAGYALCPGERRRLLHAPDGAEAAGLLAFSAKECVHKCLHPLRGIFLEFDEVEIDITATGFVPLPASAQAATALSGLRCEGYWLRTPGFVWTLLALA